MFIGPPILFENMLIRKMLDLANIKKDDVFYDLGCGYGQNLIIAATEYRVEDCIGIEDSYTRCREARRRIEKRGLDKKIPIINKNFEIVDTENADVVFYGLEPDNKMIDKFLYNLQKGCRLIFYINCPLPAIITNNSDYPFYCAVAPIKEAKSEMEWLSSLIPRKDLTIHQYWNEIIPKDTKYAFFGANNGNYKRKLKRLLRQRLT